MSPHRRRPRSRRHSERDQEGPSHASDPSAHVYGDLLVIGHAARSSDIAYQPTGTPAKATGLSLDERSAVDAIIVDIAMSAVEQVDALVAKMTRGEKAQLLQRVARDLGDAYPGIDVTDGLSGGDPCIARTRIPVWTLEQARRLGASEAELLRSYPGLRAEDLANAWAYVRTHRDQIDIQIRDHEAA